MEKFSADLFFGNKLSLSQPENGYRVSMDPFILAAHILPEGHETIIDAGCGCGIIPLVLAVRYPDLNILGIELQKALFEFAQQNIIANRLTNTIRVFHTDIKTLCPSDTGGKADIIVSNPPYKKKDSGRLNPDTQKAIARHEITLDIDELVECSGRLLKASGKLFVIFPAERLTDLILTMEKFKFFPKTIRFVHTRKNTAAKRVVLCAVRRHAGPCVIPPPFYIYASEDKYTDEYVSMFKP